MTVLFFSRLFYPHIGGVEKHVMEISKRLIRNGHKVIIVTEKIIGTEDEEVVEGINIRRIPAGKNDWFKKFRIWKEIWRNRNLIIDADIIHAHDVFFWFLPFRFLYPSKRIYITFHGYEGDKIPGFKEKFMHKIAEKLSLGNICVGDFLKKWYGTKPTYITYGGVTIPNSRLQIPNKDKKIKFLFLGRLEKETGIIEYFKSLKFLREKKYKFGINVLGDGTLAKNVKEYQIKHKIEAIFEGFVENVDPAILNCDFIFTSRYLGILEAFSCKKFVFAVYNNEIKMDYLKMTPFAKYISISKNHRELSDQIEYFLRNDQKRNEMIDGAFNWVKNQTWDKMTTTYLRLWNRD